MTLPSPAEAIALSRRRVLSAAAAACAWTPSLRAQPAAHTAPVLPSRGQPVRPHVRARRADVEPLLDALVGAVLELGRLVGVDTPCLSATYALVKLLARTMRDDKVMIRACALPA